MMKQNLKISLFLIFTLGSIQPLIAQSFDDDVQDVSIDESLLFVLLVGVLIAFHFLKQFKNSEKEQDKI
jgi:hypothetical protein